MWSYSRLGLVNAQSIIHITFQLYDVLRFEFHHHRVSCTAPVGALCVEPTIFTKAAIYHGPARGVQLRLGRGRDGQDRV